MSFRFCPLCARPLAPQPLQGRERLVCQAACGFVQWENPVPVVAVLVQYGEDIILARNPAWPPTQFSLVFGFIERHEAPTDAALREVREELGLTGEIAGFVGHFPFIAKNELVIAFHMRATGLLKLGEEIADIKRVPLASIAQYDFAPFSFTAGIVRAWQTGVAKAHTDAP